MKTGNRIGLIVALILFVLITFIATLAASTTASFFFLICYSVFLSFLIVNWVKLKEEIAKYELKEKYESIGKVEDKRKILSYSGTRELTIDYVDAEGNETNRNIIIEYIYNENKYMYIRAFCYLRNEERTFKIENIKKMYVNEAEIDDPKLYFETKINNSELSDK